MLKKQVEGFASVGAMILVLILAIAVLAIIQAATRPALPLYKQGDCIKNANEPNCEKWQTCSETIYKVIEVGNKHYHLLKGEYKPDLHEVYVHIIDASVKDGDEGTEKVECPKELNDPKTLEKANAATEH